MFIVCSKGGRSDEQGELVLVRIPVRTSAKRVTVVGDEYSRLFCYRSHFRIGSSQFHATASAAIASFVANTMSSIERAEESLVVNRRRLAQAKKLDPLFFLTKPPER